jgi:hypothetical protein
LISGKQVNNRPLQSIPTYVPLYQLTILFSNSFPETKLDDVAGCLKYYGKPATLDDDIDNPIRQGVEEM